jgi:hypothetical protein
MVRRQRARGKSGSARPRSGTSPGPKVVTKLADQPLARRGAGSGEAPDSREELVGGFDLRDVTGLGEKLELRFWDSVGVGPSVVGVDDLVALAP